MPTFSKFGANEANFETSYFRKIGNRSAYPILANVPFLSPLKKSEKPWFSETFREYRNGLLG